MPHDHIERVGERRSYKHTRDRDQGPKPFLSPNLSHHAPLWFSRPLTLCRANANWTVLYRTINTAKILEKAFSKGPYSAKRAARASKDWPSGIHTRVARQWPPKLSERPSLPLPPHPTPLG